MSRLYNIDILTRSWKLVLATGVLGALLALLFSLATPLQYSASVRILITQPNATGLDPYTAIKSTERIATSLSELMYTSTFFNSIVSQATGFDATYFPVDELNKRKAWRKAIAIGITPGTGIMNILAYHPDRAQARILVDAAAKEIAAQAPNYFGYQVRVQVIDAPLDSRWFAKPNFVTNGLFGLMVGFLVGIAWVLTRYPERS
jgi:capsular polysaccharide biosynthesis protein